MWENVWNKEQTFDSDIDHSKVFYLMAPDNQCIGFYNIELGEDELAERMLDDISYDIGIRFIGKSKKPGYVDSE
jgi:cytochrome oxidase Cu insertion factor (SCO1/SenC/PrrC family)